MLMFPGFVHMFAYFGHLNLGINGVQKIVRKLIQNMFLGPFIFGCEIRPGKTLICKL